MASAVFDDFLTLDDPQLVRMKAEANRFLCDMLDRKPPYWLTFLGTSGAGKTMLAKKISSAFRKQIAGEKVYEDQYHVERARGGFITWPSLINDVRDGEHRMFRDICGDWFVALDDIAAEHGTSFTVAKLYEFFNAREKKWTVFTGNLSLEQISENLDPRIASRMIRHGSTVVDVDVKDYNLRK